MTKVHGIELSSEDEIRSIEATGRCLINRQFTLPWFHTKQAPPQVGHIYSEIGQRETFPVVDDSGFDNISLESHSGSDSNGSVSTAYRLCTEQVPSKYTVDSVQKNTTPLTPLATTDTIDIVEVKTSNGKSNSVIKIRDIILTILLVSIALVLISTIMTIRTLRTNTIQGTGNMMAAKAYYLQSYNGDNMTSVSTTSVTTPSVSPTSVSTTSVSTTSSMSSMSTTPVTTTTSTKAHPTTTLPITTKGPIMRSSSTKKWYRW